MKQLNVFHIKGLIILLFTRNVRKTIRLIYTYVFINLFLFEFLMNLASLSTSYSQIKRTILTARLQRPSETGFVNLRYGSKLDNIE